MTREGRGVVAVVQGTQDAGLTVMMMRVSSVLRTRQEPVDNNQEVPTLDPGPSTDSGYRSSNVPNKEYYPSDILRSQNSEYSSLPKIANEFPPRRSDPSNTQGNFLTHSADLDSSFTKKKDEIRSFHRDQSPTDSFAKSLRKYPLPKDKSVSTDMVQKLLNCTQAKHLTKTQKSFQDKGGYEVQNLSKNGAVNNKIPLEIFPIRDTGACTSKEVKTVLNKGRSPNSVRIKPIPCTEDYNYLKPNTSSRRPNCESEVRFINTIKKSIRDTLKQLLDSNSSTTVCPNLADRYVNHKRVCHKRKSECRQSTEVQATSPPGVFKICETNIPAMPSRQPVTGHSPYPCNCYKPSSCPCRSGQSDDEDSTDIEEKYIDNQLQIWISEIPVAAGECINAKLDRIAMLVELKHTLLSLIGEDDFAEKAKEAIDKCVDSLPMWRPQREQEKKLFKEQISNKLFDKIKNVALLDDLKRVILHTLEDVNLEYEIMDKHELVEELIYSLLPYIHCPNELKQEICYKSKGTCIPQNVWDNLYDNILNMPVAKTNAEIENIVYEWLNAVPEIPPSITTDKTMVKYLVNKIKKLTKPGDSESQTKNKVMENVDNWIESGLKLKGEAMDPMAKLMACEKLANILVEPARTRERSNTVADQSLPGQSVPGQDVPGQSVAGQSLPGQSMPGQNVPYQSLPGQSIPGQIMPGQTMPGQSEPCQNLPRQSMPGQIMPGQSMPGQGVPYQNVPRQSMPGQKMPGQSMSTQDAPRQSVPNQKMLSQSMPGQSVPGQTMPGQNMPGQTMPGQTMLGQSIPGQTMPGPSILRQSMAGQTMPGHAMPGQSTPRQSMLGQTMPGQAMPGQTMPGQTMPGQSTTRQSMPGQSMLGQTMPGQSVPGQTMLGQAIPGQSVPGQIMPGQIIPGQTMPGQSIPGQTTPGQAMPGQSVSGHIMPGQIIPGQTMPGQTMPRQSTPGQIMPGQSTPRQSMPSQTMPGQAMPGHSIPGQTMPGPSILRQSMPGQTMQGHTMPGQSTPRQSMPGQTMPDQAMPGQSVPGQIIPGQTMPGQSTPRQSMPGQTLPGQTMPRQSMPGQRFPGQTTPGQSMPRQSMPGQTMPGQDMSGHSMPGQTMPGQTLPGQIMPGQTMPRQSMPSHSVQGQTIPGQSIPGQTIPGQIMPGQTMPRQSMPGQIIPGQRTPSQFKQASPSDDETEIKETVYDWLHEIPNFIENVRPDDQDVTNLVNNLRRRTVTPGEVEQEAAKFLETLSSKNVFLNPSKKRELASNLTDKLNLGPKRKRWSRDQNTAVDANENDFNEMTIKNDEIKQIIENEFNELLKPYAINDTIKGDVINDSTRLLVDQVIRGTDSKEAFEQITSLLQSANLDDSDIQNVTDQLYYKTHDLRMLRNADIPTNEYYPSNLNRSAGPTPMAEASRTTSPFQSTLPTSYKASSPISSTQGPSRSTLPTTLSQRRPTLQKLAETELLNFVNDISGDMSDVTKKQVQEAAKEVSKTIHDIMAAANEKNIENLVLGAVTPFVESLPISSDIDKGKLAKNLTDRITGGIDLRTSTPFKTLAKAGPDDVNLSNIDSDSNPKAEKYANELRNVIHKWVDTCLDELKLKDDISKVNLIVDNLVDDMVERQKYLQLNPETITSPKEELENLRFQIYKSLNKTLKPSDIAKIIPTAELLLKKIKEVRVPNLTKSDQKSTQFQKASDMLAHSVESWTNDLPLKADTPEELAKIKQDLTNKLIHKITELNMNPEVFKDDFLYKDLLQDEINDLLSKLPVAPEEIANLPKVKRKLLNKVLEAREKLQKELAGQEYRQNIRDTISKTLSTQSSCHDHQGSFDALKENLADAFISLNYFGDNEEQKAKYREKIENEIMKFCNNYLKNHPNAPISSHSLNEELYKALSDVPMPKSDTLKNEVEVIMIKDAMADWIQGLPIKTLSPADRQQIGKKIHVLAKKIHEIEKEKKVDADVDSEDKMKKEVTKWISRNFEQMEDNEIEAMADKLVNVLRTTEQERALASQSPTDVDEVELSAGEKRSPTLSVKSSSQSKPEYTQKSPEKTIQGRPIIIQNQKPKQASPPIVEDTSSSDYVTDSGQPKGYCIQRQKYSSPCGSNQIIITPNVVVKEYCWDSGSKTRLFDCRAPPCAVEPTKPSCTRPVCKPRRYTDKARICSRGVQSSLPSIGSSSSRIGLSRECSPISRERPFSPTGSPVRRAPICRNANKCYNSCRRKAKLGSFHDLIGMPCERIPPCKHKDNYWNERRRVISSDILVDEPKCTCKANAPPTCPEIKKSSRHDCDRKRVIRNSAQCPYPSYLFFK